MKKHSFALMAFAVAGCDTAPEPAKPVGPPVAVTAVEISKVFQENEAKAQLQFGNKTLEVSGTVKEINLDMMDAPVVKLKGSGDEYGMGINQEGKMTDVDINGLANTAAANINKGQKLTFTCTSITEAMGGAGLSGCTLKAK